MLLGRRYNGLGKPGPLKFLGRIGILNAMEIILQIIVNGLLLSTVYGLLAAGISFLYSTSRIFHLAHGIAALGAGYAFWWMWVKLGFHPALGVIFAVLVAALLGFLMNEYVYEYLRHRGAKGLGYLIATLALLILGTGIILALFGAAPKTFNFQTETVEFGGVTITTFQILMLLIAAFILTGFWWITKFTKFGKAMRATSDNETVAEVLGIDTRMVRRKAFVLASILAASAGIIYGMEFGLDPARGVTFAVFGFAAAVVGGAGSFSGAVLGSVVIAILEQVIVWYSGGGFRNAAVFILLFLFLLLKPEGIFGTKKTS